MKFQIQTRQNYLVEGEDLAVVDSPRIELEYAPYKSAVLPLNYEPISYGAEGEIRTHGSGMSHLTGRYTTIEVQGD